MRLPKVIRIAIIIKDAWEELGKNFRNLWRKSRKIRRHPMLEAPPDYKKMYVLVNKSQLTLQQCAVQSGHAVAEFMALYGNDENTNDWCFNKNHRTMIILAASEKQIIKMMAIYDDLNLKHRSFREPDLNNMLTAVAFEPVWSEQGKTLFGKFNLI